MHDDSHVDARGAAHELVQSAGYVLVVDDVADIRDTLREVVEMGGCSVVTAENGKEALSILRDRPPCLAIIDLRMPIMSGSELIELMSRDPALTDVPILVSTSAPERAPRGYPVLPKPVDIDALWDILRKTCLCGKNAPEKL
jgi:CheY-like chemotaxis protein